MANASGRAQLPRLPDVPEKAYERPARHGDPLSLAALRSHLARCQDCQEKKECSRRTSAIKVYGDSVKLAAGKSLRARP